MNTNLNALLRFVQDHDCASDARIENRAIYATLASWDREHVRHEEWSRVGATLQECRDWLGY